MVADRERRRGREEEIRKRDERRID